jgi:hypothetical protein
MIEWWNLLPCEMTSEALQERTQAYQEVLLMHPLGRYVMADIIRIREITRHTADDPAYYVGMDQLVSELLGRCGLNIDIPAQLEALMPIAAKCELPEEPERNLI